MNRLRDDIQGDGPPPEADQPIPPRGLELLRRVPSTAPSPEMRARVWAALQDPRRRAVGRGRAASPAWVFATIAVVVGLCGTAGAVIARRWVVARRSARAAAAVLPTPVDTTPRRIAPHPHTLAAATPAPATTTDETSPVIDAPAARPPRPVHRTTPRPSAVSAKMLAAHQPTPAERTQVLDAMIALRRDHDAVRAGSLLGRYLTAHPRGALREEALVLAIEAAAARADQPAAHDLAAQYLRAYPAGRFTEFARSQD